MALFALSSCNRGSTYAALSEQTLSASNAVAANRSRLSAGIAIRFFHMKVLLAAEAREDIIDRLAYREKNFIGKCVRPPWVSGPPHGPMLCLHGTHGRASSLLCVCVYPHAFSSLNNHELPTNPPFHPIACMPLITMTLAARVTAESCNVR